MFPDFNIYSSPLLILVLQGLILAALLFYRYSKKKVLSDVFLAVLILVFCYHRTTYTIGFMGWYDTFRNTKINYFLIPLSLSVGPLIYFYIRSAIEKGFRLNFSVYRHYIPLSLFVLIKVFLFLYDSVQPGFDETQNGIAHNKYWDTIGIPISIMTSLHLLVYLVASFRLYLIFRNRLKDELSNTFRYELRWFRNFLYIYSFLFLYDLIQSITDGFILDLHWTQEWWYQFFCVLAILYVGVKGYFHPIDHLHQIILKDNKTAEIKKNLVFEFEKELQHIKQVVEEQKLYRDPNLSLNQLSRTTKINSAQLSLVINKGLHKNFNDFINEYRVEEIKNKFREPKYTHFTILAIAFDSGFNSKATFNRVFKKITTQSPSEFRNNISL